MNMRSAMENSAYIALSRQSSLRSELNIVANNIANANTTGFKREGMVFQEYLNKPAHDKQQFSFVQGAGLARDLSDGALHTTGNSFDLGLSGEGYFVVETPQGQRFTRNGRFQMNAEGNLTTAQGYQVLSGGAPINIPQDQGRLNVSKDGTISTDEGEIGKVDVVKFDDPRELKKAAGGLYLTTQPPQAAENYTIQQGMLEDSNVEPILEMTRMMTLNREYSSIQKFTQAEDQRIKKAIQRLGQFS